MTAINWTHGLQIRVKDPKVGKFRLKLTWHPILEGKSIGSNQKLNKKCDLGPNFCFK